MKKTLIALAALAATGASFAQVTITGNLTSGYSQTITNSYTKGTPLTFVATTSADQQALGLVAGTSNSTGTPLAIFNLGQQANITALQSIVPAARTLVQQATLDTLLATQARLAAAAAPGRLTTQQMGASGFGVDTAEIFITAKEDIGGGQSVEAKLGLTNMARGGAGTGAFGANDVTLTYTNTSFGRLQYGNTYGAAVFSGYPSAGAPVVDMDGKLFELRSASEYINYAAPIGPITVVVQMGEATAGTGLGVGQSGTPATVGQRSTMLLGLYREGPIEAFLAYKTFDNPDATSITGVNKLTKDRQWSLQGAYDLGMAKVGFGYAYTTASIGATVSDMLVGVNVPMGALEIGATWGQEIVSGIAGVPATAFGTGLAGAIGKATLSQAEGTATGWSVGAKYNLSKRTSFKANYAAWTRSGYEQFEAFGKTNNTAEFGYGPIETQANLLLSHSF